MLQRMQCRCERMAGGQDALGDRIEVDRFDAGP
jgi:hypothetical protein